MKIGVFGRLHAKAATKNSKLDGMTAIWKYAPVKNIVRMHKKYIG